MFQWEDSRFFNKKAFDQAHAFYEKYGGITIVAARFMPFLRTFAPFVAGVAQMTRRKFTLYDVTGGALWVGGIITAGYFFGSVPWVKDNLDKIIWAMILMPGLLVLFGAWRARRARHAHRGASARRDAPERPGHIAVVEVPAGAEASLERPAALRRSSALDLRAIRPVAAHDAVRRRTSRPPRWRRRARGPS